MPSEVWEDDMAYQDPLPADEKVYTASYRRFKGVDVTTAITEVDRARSPFAPNMVANNEGFPEKRTGYALVKSFDAGINGIHAYLRPNGVKRMLVHAGTELYAYDPAGGGEPELIYGAMADARSTSFVFGGKIYLLDGAAYIRYDGQTAGRVDADAYVPTTSIASPPEGGGEELELANLLSPVKINRFLGTAAATVYQLDTESVTSVIKCEKLAADGIAWTEITAYTADLLNGRVTFAAPPGDPPVSGEDNIRITFQKNVAGNADKINKCTINAFYGIGNDHRIFVSGNSEKINYDWYSGSARADYFPDLNYSVVGSETGAIMGYLKQYSDLVIVKEENDQDASVFLRSAEIGAENTTIFTVKQGLAGVGAASRYCFGTLADDNVFLSREGVFGLDTSSVTLQKTLQPRSYYVNRALCDEPALSGAVSCVHDGRYYLFVNGNVYVADSTQPRNKNMNTSFGYEWYFWTNVPARSARVYNDAVWFGSAEGGLFRFKQKTVDADGVYSDAGAPIYAAWTTKMDSLGDPSVVKKIQKNGTGVVVMPFVKTSGRIYYITTDETLMVKEYEMNTAFDFSAVDFGSFGFGLVDEPRFVPTRKKYRKARMLQMMVENDAADEAFGVYEIKVDYAYTKPIKR